MANETVKKIAIDGSNKEWFFKIIGIKIHSEEELIACMRKVPLMNQIKHVKPYEHAKLEIVTVDPNDLIPPQFYVLQSDLDKLSRLRNLIFEYTDGSLDIFMMRGYAEIKTDQGDYTIYPPVVEISEPDGGIKLINDGMHRIFMARYAGIKINVLLVSGVDPNYPYYAMPNPEGWSGVEVTTCVPQKKKIYRFPKGVYRGYYRNFNVGFTNSTGSRQNAPK